MTLVPVKPAEVRVDDIVFVRWKGNFLLHLIRETGEDRVLIGNALGKINGWIGHAHVLGKVVAIQP